MHIRRQLGTGEDINPFYDQWTSGNGGSLAAQYSDSLIPTNMQSWKVSGIMQNGNWVLKKSFAPVYVGSDNSAADSD